MYTNPMITPEKKALLERSMAMFDAAWDEAAGMVLMKEDGVTFHSSRDTAFYALGLLERRQDGDLQRACRCVRAVLDCQITADGEIFDGTFRAALEQDEPVRGMLDWRDMDPLTRYYLDIYEQRLVNKFRGRLRADSALAPLTPSIEACLHDAVKDSYPVVWETYDPNWREFIVSTFQLMLFFYEDQLPRDLVDMMEGACRRAIRTAVLRATTGFTPLNTNIRIMHVMICDWFGERWQERELRAHAEGMARELLQSYRVHHAVAEFNSPTYNGVVFTFIGFWQTICSNPALHEMGRELEEGMWRDFADFYNPAMHNVCGPYSRAYELEMTVHTALPAVLYAAGIGSVLPPLSTESDCDPVLALAQLQIPQDVIPLLQKSRGERAVFREFEELAERGDPRSNHALCTVTSWITDRLMIGAMRGSRNTSYQLHPAVVFWRNSEGSLSTIKLLRRTAEGELKHLHTVYFDFEASPEKLSGTVRACAGRDILPYFEIETPHPETAGFSGSVWKVDGLTAQVSAVNITDGRSEAAGWYTEIVGPAVRVYYPMADRSQLKFEIRFTLE